MMKLSKLVCLACQAENERNADVCKGCGNPLGFVNVNLLSDPYFQKGLYDRYVATVMASKLNAEVQRFEAVVASDGKAVINMDSKLLFILVNENEDYLSYQRAVEEGKRTKASFGNDRDRCVVESAFYGFDGRNIVYAALALDDIGLSTYGDVCVVLKTKNIEQRTTVFEKNTYFLFDELVAGGWRVRETIPAGHCGIWNERAKVAVIKHGLQIRSSQQAIDFAAMILKSDDDRTKDEFMELHIFNKVNPTNFEKATFQKKLVKTYNQVQFKILKSKLSNLRVEVNEV